MTMRLNAAVNGTSALAVRVHGLVQGVGFRPFVHRLALRHGLTGWVRNDSAGVQIAIDGPSGAIRDFLKALIQEAPPLARIDSLDVTPTHDRFHRFEIAASAHASDRRQPVSPDVALCAECRRELFHPSNRRFRYPFITCTDCGPRFTVIDAMPYDRERTSMRMFEQCPACRAEYESPGDRRHHSETNSCATCGPRLLLLDIDRSRLAEGDDALRAAARLLRLGLVVALRGLGGFHLAVDATNEQAVARLRARKRRDEKPLAVMVATARDARRLAQVDALEQRLLESPQRPIVLVRRNPHAPLARSIAPGLDTIGVMTAYTPLHVLLLHEARRPLVMTSGNRSEEPIATSNDDAVSQLADVADAFLIHDRDIVARYDDSVVRVVDDAPVMLRRARGYAPLPVPLPIATPAPLIAVGPHLKHTFTLAHDAMAYVSQHIGDLENVETLEHFQSTLAKLRALFRIDPTVAVRDKHPSYLSTRVAEELGLQRVIAVQHHHAHLAAVAAEHGITDRVIGVTFDGTGYGDDGRAWGGEILVGDLTSYRRAAHLRYAPLPGGDLVARQPWRAALGYLQLEPAAALAFARAFDTISEQELRLARQQADRGLNAPLSSSMGRLFDAAAAILGVRRVARFEGQAAMELEALAGTVSAPPLPFSVIEQADGTLLFDPLPSLIALGQHHAAGVALQSLAARFHETIAAATAALVEQVSAGGAGPTVVLGGGVFQNARLLSSLRRRLEALGLHVLIPRQLSPNDGAISYGQAAVAAALLQSGQ